MYRDSYYDKIIELIKRQPMSQREIWDILNPISSVDNKRKEIITLQGIAKNLTLGVKNGVIIYLGNKVSKRDAKWFLKDYFVMKWPTDAWQCYIYVPNTERFYQRLKSKLKDKPIDREIVLFYSIIELSAMLQNIMYENPNVIKRDFKSRRQELTDKEIKQKIARKRREIKEFYKNRDKTDHILKFLQFTPLMHWCAFKRPVPVEAKEYDSSKDLVQIKDVLFEKLRELL